MQDLLERLEQAEDGVYRTFRKQRPFRTLRVPVRARNKEVERMAKELANAILQGEIEHEAQRLEQIEREDREYQAPVQSVSMPLAPLINEAMVKGRERQRNEVLGDYLQRFPLGAIVTVDRQGLVNVRPATEADLDSLENRGYIV